MSKTHYHLADLNGDVINGKNAPGGAVWHSLRGCVKAGLMREEQHNNAFAITDENAEAYEKLLKNHTVEREEIAVENSENV